jgi:putative DNA primase/helicase
MLQLARSEPGIPVQPDELDRDSSLLNCPNGTINLRSGMLHPHRPDDLLTQLCPTEFCPDATAPIWDDFLTKVFSGDSEVISFVQRFLGYCMTADTSESVMLVAVGNGANGKSTLLGTVLHVLGDDYGIVPDKSILVRQRTSGHSTELMDLFGKRLAVASETEDSQRLNESTVKALTGGDAVRGRRMREDTWQFLPTNKFVLQTNHKPTIQGSDDGIWRRLILLNFEQRFWNPDSDRTGPAELSIVR